VKLAMQLGGGGGAAQARARLLAIRLALLADFFTARRRQWLVDVWGAWWEVVGESVVERERRQLEEKRREAVVREKEAREREVSELQVVSRR